VPRPDPGESQLTRDADGEGTERRAGEGTGDRPRGVHVAEGRAHASTRPPDGEDQGRSTAGVVGRGRNVAGVIMHVDADCVLTNVRVLLINALVVLGSVLPAGAQAIATDFEQLRFKVGAGDFVYVTDNTGRIEQRARVIELTASSLVVSIDGARRDLAESHVRRIRQRLPDTLWNGALIGSAVSIGTGAAIAIAVASGESLDVASVGIGLAFYGGIGALVGMGVDAMVKGRKTIYEGDRPNASMDFAVRPVVLHERKSISVTVRF
jgi:hypothetical protein